jgi:hypothetical protein
MLARVKLKGIDGGPHKRWSMWFNSMQREEPYQGLTWYEFFWKKKVPFGTYTQVVHGCRQLVSWDVGLSPATSATPIFSCHFWNSRKTAGYKPEEGGDDVKSACPLHPGLHTCYIGRDNEMLICEDKLIYKLVLSSDCRLQLACMKVESLVIAGQHTAVNPFPGLVHTARHTMEAGYARSRYSNRLEEDA